jgi:hypothetical protein
LCDGPWIIVGSNTSANLSGLSNDTTYYWQVRAVNSSGATFANNNEWWSFLTSPGVVHVYLPLVLRPTTPLALPNGDFESGNAAWVEYSEPGWPPVIWPLDHWPPAHSGVWAAWLGDDWLGGDVEISYIQQQVTVPASAPYLAYWHWIDSVENCGYDFASVRVNGSVVETYDLCSSANTYGWVKHVVNLSAYTGQPGPPSVALQIRVETHNGWGSILLVDDVAFQATASTTALAPGNSGDE